MRLLEHLIEILEAKIRELEPLAEDQGFMSEEQLTLNAEICGLQFAIEEANELLRDFGERNGRSE